MHFDVLSLGLLQGLTEFLPVSSSGHLGIAQILMGAQDTNFAFDLVLHMATLMAVVLFFCRDIATLFTEWVYGFFNRKARNWEGWRFGWAMILGTMVTGPLGILLKPWAEMASLSLLWLGGNLWITAALLYSTKYMQEGRDLVSVKAGVITGFVQGLAVMPGVSRSGSTIWIGLLCGLSREEAFRFSFLLSIPAIVGATLYEARDLGGSAEFFSALPEGWIWGALVAFISGLGSLFLLRRLLISDRWRFFAWYCALIGSVAVVYSLIRM